MADILAEVGGILFVVLALNSIVFLVCNHPASTRLRSRNIRALPHPSRPPAADGARLVSIHLAMYDEPADVVIATLAALRALEYPRFEVLVIDNNTPAPATWRPVEDYCRGDRRLRFHHFDGVSGAKAGALNIALELMDPAAEYVAVVDADYQVIPRFIDIAVTECERHGDDFVQFPQSYRSTSAASAIERELSDYFAVYSSRASSAGAMLPTGTLSLIRSDALRKVGGWPTCSVTEDAEIGMRMWQAGATGRYIDRQVGRGMLPLDLKGLRSQRYRWAAGNARTLFSHLATGPGNWPVQGRWAVIAQLTAWIGFGAAPVLCLAAALPVQLTDRTASPIWPWVEMLATYSLLAMLLTLAATACLRGRPETLPVKLALFWTSSFAWLPQIWRSATPFLRTPKDGTSRHSTLSIETIVSVAALVMAIGYLGIGHWSAALVLIASASALPVSPLVDRALRRAALHQATA